MTLLLLAAWLPVAALADEPAEVVEDEPAESIDPTKSPITVATTADSPGPFSCKVDPYITVHQGETVGVRIILTVPDSTKLYRDQVEVEVEDAAGLVVGSLVLPAGHPFEDPWGGGPREVYTGDTEITLPLGAPIDAKGRFDMSLSVRWQGCSDHMCYMPGGQDFNVPVRIKRAR